MDHQGLLSREESPTPLTSPLANASMLSDLVPQPIMPPRKHTRATHRALERDPFFRLMGFHVKSQSVKTCEFAITVRITATEMTPLVVRCFPSIESSRIPSF